MIVTLHSFYVFIKNKFKWLDEPEFEYLAFGNIGSDLAYGHANSRV